MAAPESSVARVFKSKIFSGNPLLPKDDFDERMEKCYAVLNNLVAGLSEREIHDTLNQTVCKSMKEHEEISFGLLYTILTEQNNASKSYRDLSYISRDGFNLILSKLIQIISDKFARLLETPRAQVLWLAGEMMKNSVIGVDNVVLALLKQIAGGDVSPGNVWLAENTVKMLQTYRAWLDKNPTVIPTAVYTYLRVLEDHDAQPFRSLRQQEIDFCIMLLKEKFAECMTIGRDLVRLLQNNTRIPEFTSLWKDILYRPQSLSPQFTGLGQLLNTRTSRKLLASRLTQEMENKMTFLALKVRFGQQKRYQDWFFRQYLSAPEAQSLIPDLVRFLCGVIHPPNEVLCSDIIPRWAILGWLFTSCQNPVAQANVKLAMFYDWLFYSGDKDNIMNIEPAILLMHNSIRTHPNITYGLLEFICKMMDSYSTQLDTLVKQGVKKAFRSILDKRVVVSLAPLLNNHRMDRNIKTLVREALPEFSVRDKNATSSRQEEIPPSPTAPSPLSSPKTEQAPSVSLVPVQESKEVEEAESGAEEVAEGEVEEAVFSDEDDDQEKDLQSKSRFKPIVKDEDDNGKADEGLGSEDVTDLEEFQNIDNNLLRDNILKLKNDSDDSKRCEAMESVISTVDSMKDFDDEMASPICVCLAACLMDDLAMPCLPDNATESKTDQQVEKPQHILFRSITSLSKQDIDREKLYVLLNGLHELDQKIGYHFLYFLKAFANDDEFFNYEDYINYQKDKTLRTALTSDLRACHQYDPKLFLFLISPIFKVFKNSAVGNPETIRMVCSAVSPIEIREIVSHISMGELLIIGENQVESLLVSSLSWDSFEQNCLWQFLVAEETPVEMVVGLLPHLKPEDHPEALSHLLVQLRHESPTADVLRPLLCMECCEKPGLFQLSTCLFKYWCQEEARELAHVIAQLLTKLVCQSGKRRKGRGSARYQPTAEQILSHLDQYRKVSHNAKSKGLFTFESLRRAIEQVKFSITDNKVQSRFRQLFDDCWELGKGRVTRTSRRRKPANESSDESSSEQDDDNDDDDDENRNEEDGNAPESGDDDDDDNNDDDDDDDDDYDDSGPVSRSPSKKRRRTTVTVDSDED